MVCHCRQGGQDGRRVASGGEGVVHDSGQGGQAGGRVASHGEGVGGWCAAAVRKVGLAGEWQSWGVGRGWFATMSREVGLAGGFKSGGGDWGGSAPCCGQGGQAGGKVASVGGFRWVLRGCCGRQPQGEAVGHWQISFRTPDSEGPRNRMAWIHGVLAEPNWASFESPRIQTKPNFPGLHTPKVHTISDIGDFYFMEVFVLVLLVSGFKI